jgi:hypothetical protein
MRSLRGKLSEGAAFESFRPLNDLWIGILLVGWTVIFSRPSIRKTGPRSTAMSLFIGVMFVFCAVIIIKSVASLVELWSAAAAKGLLWRVP